MTTILNIFDIDGTITASNKDELNEWFSKMFDEEEEEYIYFVTNRFPESFEETRKWLDKKLDRVDYILRCVGGVTFAKALSNKVEEITGIIKMLQYTHDEYFIVKIYEDIGEYAHSIARMMHRRFPGLKITVFHVMNNWNYKE